MNKHIWSLLLVPSAILILGSTASPALADACDDAAERNYNECLDMCPSDGQEPTLDSTMTNAAGDKETIPGTPGSDYYFEVTQPCHQGCNEAYGNDLDRCAATRNLPPVI